MQKRNLSGIYFRSRQPDGRYDNVVFEDLSEEEQRKVLEDRSVEWLKSLAIALGKTLREIGDTFDIGKE